MALGHHQIEKGRRRRMVWGMGGEESPSLPFPNDFQTIAYWPRADPALPLLRRRNENAWPGLSLA